MNWAVSHLTEKGAPLNCRKEMVFNSRKGREIISKECIASGKGIGRGVSGFTGTN